MIFSQGDIISIDFSPTQGHEQSGLRPALIVSNDTYNIKTGYLVVCPITNTMKPFPTRIALDSRTKTMGLILCEQIRTIDVEARDPKFIEKTPEDIFQKAIRVVAAIFDISSG